MPRFFVSSENFKQNSVEITGDDAWHIARSLRMAVGESIIACDKDGVEYDCVLKSITDDLSVAEICDSRKSETESPVRITVYQAFPKGDKMDTIVQKAVEMGVHEIVPFFSDRCISRPDPHTFQKKCSRWQRIALEAAKQCGRGMVPEVKEPVSFAQMLELASKASVGCFCYEGEGTVSIKEVLDAARDVKEISVVIGSEGGFTEKEAAEASGTLTLVGLGKRILRCESAPGFALACIAYKFEL